MTSLVLGIVSLLFCLVPIVNNLAAVSAILGGIFGVVALVSASRGKRTGKGMAIAGTILSVLAFVGVLASQAYYSSVVEDVGEDISAAVDDADDAFQTATGGNTETVLAEQLDVAIGEYTYSEDEYGFGEGRLFVTVTNTGDAVASFDFQVEALDSSGVRIAEDMGFAPGLQPGASSRLELFAFASDGEALQDATFRVSQASAY